MNEIHFTDQGFPSQSEMNDWGMESIKSKNWEEAAKRWRLIRSLYPESELAWVQGGIAEKEINNFSDADTILKHACDHFPSNPTPWVVRADMYIEQYGFGTATEILLEIQKLFPQLPYPLLKRAENEARKGDYQQAEVHNLAARTLFNNHINPHMQYAELAENQCKWDEAIIRWEEFRNLFPHHPAGYRRAALVAEKIGKTDLARQLKKIEQFGRERLVEVNDSQINDVDEKLTPLQSRGWLHMSELIWTKSRMNLKSEANQNYLRHVWWILDPLLYMVVFYVVFGLFLERGGENYIVYLLTGLVPFQWFAKTTQLSSGSILSGRGLMNQVRIPPIFFPLVMVVQTTGKQLLIFVMLILFLLFYGVEPDIHWIGLVPIVIAQLALIVWVSCAVAMIVPFVRDVSNLVPTGIQFVMFASAIFYSVESLSKEWKFYFYLNPIATLINEYRTVLLYGDWPSWSSLGWVMLFAIGGIFITGFVYKSISHVYPRVVIE